MIDVRTMRPLDAPLALDDQVITVHPDGSLLGDEPGNFCANNEMVLGFEDFDWWSPGGNTFLPLTNQRLRNVKRHLNVNC